MGQPRDTYRLKSKGLLKAYMDAGKWSVRDLAHRCDVGKSIIQDLRSDNVDSKRPIKMTCSRTLAARIEEALAVPPGILFEPVVRQNEDATGQTAAKKRAA